MTPYITREDGVQIMMANRDRSTTTPGSASGARRPTGAKVGEPHTKDASRNNVKSGARTPQATKQTFFIPGPLPGANDIIRKHHMVYSTLKSRWGLTIARCILVAKLKPVRHCHVSFTWNERHDRRDPDNVIFGQKFVLDALRDTNIIPDDTREHILSLTHCVLTYASKPGVYVTIEEVQP
jgi:Holliday junction resolvase RusA-like endonuclease